MAGFELQISTIYAYNFIELMGHTHQSCAHYSCLLQSLYDLLHVDHLARVRLEGKLHRNIPQVKAFIIAPECHEVQDAATISALYLKNTSTGACMYVRTYIYVSPYIVDASLYHFTCMYMLETHPSIHSSIPHALMKLNISVLLHS